MIRRPPRSTLSSSSAASDVYKRQGNTWDAPNNVADEGVEFLVVPGVDLNAQVSIARTVGHVADLLQIGQLHGHLTKPVGRDFDPHICRDSVPESPRVDDGTDLDDATLDEPAHTVPH